MHRQTDGQTDRQKQTDYNNPLLSLSVNKEGGGIFIILLITISVLFSLFFFQFLDSPSQKITIRDFHQEVTFKQYFYLHQQFMFLCANCLFVYLSGFFFLGGVGGCMGGGGGVGVCV